MMDRVTEDKIGKYLETTAKALKAVTIGEDKGIDWKKNAAEFLDMAERYFQDAQHYRKIGDLVTAFAAVNYAHAWIDAGVRLGLLDAPAGSSDFIMPRE